MRVIALATQKGGAGKTTLCGHLAVQAERAGDGPVALIDSDPQASLADWWNERSKFTETPRLVQIGPGGLRVTLDALQEHDIRTVLIDTPGRIDNAIQEIIGMATLVVVPAKPSPHDLRVIVRTAAMISKIGTRMAFIVNDAPVRGRMNASAEAVMAAFGSVSKTLCHTRQDYKTSMIDGRTAVEIDPMSAAAEEIAEVWKFVRKMADGGIPNGR